MKFQAGRYAAILALAAALTLASASVQADRAVVVGVNQYPNLQADASLAGCVNDAQTMAETLKKYHFDVQLLTDGQATKQGIMDALKAVETGIRPDERFVFFFAGHGDHSTDNTGVILPSDAKQSSESNDITQNDLYETVRRIPARSRTVLLDSCFSGAMTRKVGDRTGKRKGRFYGRAIRNRAAGTVTKGVREAQDTPQPINGKDDPGNFAAGGPEVCYFVAARKYEMAHEDEIGGVRHGYFTYNLAQRLSGSRDRWGDVQKDVSGSVAAAAEGIQHPVLSSPYVDVAIFDPKDGPKPTPKPTRTVWDDFSEDRVEPGSLTLEMNPNTNTVVLEDGRFNLRLMAGHEGYLVLLARDAAGEIQLLYPKTRKADDGKMAAGQELKLPQSVTNYKVDVEGMQEFKAILFGSADRAQALMAAFPETNSIQSAGMARQRAVREAEDPVKALDFVTASLSFQVVPKEQGAK